MVLDAIVSGLLFGLTLGMCAEDADLLPLIIAERFRMACAAAGWTLDRAARELGCAGSTLTMKLQGVAGRALTAANIEKLARLDMRFARAWDESAALAHGLVCVVLTRPQIKAALRESGTVEVA